MTDEEIEKNHRCEFDLDEQPCEKCKKDKGPCYFLSDGGYEPRDGTHLCLECLKKLFKVCENFVLGISCDCDECRLQQSLLEQEFEESYAAIQSDPQ